MCRQVFLESLLSSGRYKYKRYAGLPLRYAGGKSLAVGHIVENIPHNVNKIVSPFFGGGSVEIACARELGMSVVGYDIFDVLVAYWQQQIKNPKALANALQKLNPDAATYQEIKGNLRQHWLNQKRIRSQVQLAAHYWFNHNLSYGPGFLGWMSKIYKCPSRYQRLVDKVRRTSLPNVTVSNVGFEESIVNHKNDFLYCDPPYYLDGNSKMFRGIYPQRNFPIHHKNFNHEELNNLLQKHCAGFILSYNDCRAVREWYAGYEIREVKWQYTLGQGENRIGKNRINAQSNHVKKSHELLIIGQRN